MNTTKHLVLIALAASFIVVILLAALAYLLFQQPCHLPISRLDVGNERSISIYEECGWHEISAGIYYDVREAGNILIPIRFIEFYDLEDIDRFTFEAVYAEDRSLVGVYDTTGLFEEIIMVDFKTGKAWPLAPNSMSHNSADRIDLVERLKLENPELFPTATPMPTQVLPTATLIPKPTPTNTLVIQATEGTSSLSGQR